MTRTATQVAITRQSLAGDHDISSRIAAAVMGQLDELDDLKAIDTLGVGGRWDPLTDAFLVSTWIEDK